LSTDKDASSGIVWLNGQLTDFSSARVALEDRGFEFGDGIYEVVRAYNGRFLALREHLIRLEQSAAGIELTLPMSLDQFASLAGELLEKSGLPDAEMYLQVTRGVSRRNHLFPADSEPTVVMGVRAPRVVSPVLWEQGCAVITLDDERWARCNLKTICLLPNILAKQRAQKAGAFEALLVRDGILTEGATCNVFLRRGDDLVTPIADNRILPGVTRAIAIQLAREIGRNVFERDVQAAELFDADEVIITSTTVELMPVARVDGKVIGDGKPGPEYLRLHAEFRSLCGSK
jgi:D-alanine transaminase